MRYIRRKPKKQNIGVRHSRTNEKITAPQVRLVDDEGKFCKKEVLTRSLEKMCPNLFSS